MNDLISAMLAAFVLFLAPGPTNALLAAFGATGSGKIRSAMLAQACGYLITVSLLLLARAGLEANPIAAIGMRLLAALWLLWSGFRLLTKRSQSWYRPESVPPRQIFVATLLNPKSLVYAFGIAPAATDWGQIFLTVAALLGLTAVSGSLWLAGGRLLAFLGAKPYARRTAGIVLVVFALVLLKPLIFS